MSVSSCYLSRLCPYACYAPAFVVVVVEAAGVRVRGARGGEGGGGVGGGAGLMEQGRYRKCFFAGRGQP